MQIFLKINYYNIVMKIRRANVRDIPKLIEIVIENDKRGYFYHTRKGDTKNLFDENWYKKNLDSIIVTEDSEILGFAVWKFEDDYKYNWYTLVHPNFQGKCVGKLLYSAVLSEDVNVKTEFVTNPYAYKIIKFWEKFDVKPFGFNATPSTYNSKGEFFGDIIGGRFKPYKVVVYSRMLFTPSVYIWREKIIAPSYSKKFIEFLLKIHGLNDYVKVKYVDAKPEDVFPWSIYDYTIVKDFRKGKGIVGGYIPNKGLILTSIDEKILKQIEENLNQVKGVWKEAFEAWYSTL